MPTLCTFNVNNLFLRYNFSTTYPGDRSRKSEIVRALWGYLPEQKPKQFEVFNEQQRQLEGAVLKLDDGKLPDILCLQEVETLAALRMFNEHYLAGHYPYAVLVDSRDMRQIDVGLLSVFPIIGLRTNVDMLDPLGEAKSPWLFSRDCLEVVLDLRPQETLPLTVFINHFKSKLAQGKTKELREADAERSAQKRLRQAQGVVNILAERFPGESYTNSLFAVVGDLNDEPGSPPVQHLINQGRLFNVLEKLPESERWTHFYKSARQVSQFDYLLLSPALAGRLDKGPSVNRKGIGGSGLSKRDGSLLPEKATLVGANDARLGKVDFTFERLPGVGPDNVASDHCPVSIGF